MKALFTSLDFDDCAEMAALHATGFTETWDAEAFRALLSQKASRAFGLKSDGRLLSFVLLTHVADEAEIITITTAEAERGKGLALQLLQEVIAFLAKEGAEKIFLDVAEDNQPAVKLYTSCGFIRYGRRKGYYHGVDALLMTRHL